MPLVPTSTLVATAHRTGTGVAAFNVITIEHIEAVAAGAVAAGLPAILQVSQNAVKFHHGLLEPVAAAARAIASASQADLSLHLDHVEDIDLLHAAPAAGFSSVMFDASKLAYAENVRTTAEAAAFAHSHGMWLEAELGRVGGKEDDGPTDAHAPGVRTDPQEAADYIAATGVDALAVAVGSSHAMTERTAALDHELIGRLRKAVDIPLVLHGSSGVPDAVITEAIRSGMTKINIGTALNIAFTAAVRGSLQSAPELVDPRKFLVPARTAIADTVAHLLQVAH
jgi:fructose-bisphosphate aldolase class II